MQKKAAHVFWAAYSGLHTAHYRSRHKFVGSTIRRTFEHFFFSQLLVSKPHTKSSSALDYMTDIVRLT